jgi:hypothetical protein
MRNPGGYRWWDLQRPVWGRFMEVVDEYPKEEGAK